MVTSRLEGAAYVLLRVVSGSMFALHGAQKILGWPAASSLPRFGSQLWLGGVIELVGGLLIALGLFTRPAAFFAAGTMAVAYFQFHWKLQMESWKWLPTVNMGELAVIYCFVFLFIMARGAGAVSLAALTGRRSRR